MGTSKFPGTAQFIRQKAKTESIAFSDGRVYYTQTVDTRTEICCFDISAADFERAVRTFRFVADKELRHSRG